MKFNEGGELLFVDDDGDALRVIDLNDRLIVCIGAGKHIRTVSMSYKEARKFAKAIRKEVRKVQ